MGCGASTVAPDGPGSDSIAATPTDRGGGSAHTFRRAQSQGGYGATNTPRTRPTAITPTSLTDEVKDIEGEYASRAVIAQPLSSISRASTAVLPTSSSTKDMSVSRSTAGDLIENSISQHRRGVTLKISSSKSQLVNPPLRILFLGPSESGKTTVKHQIKIMSKFEFTQTDRMPFVAALHQNIISNLQQILRGLQILRRELAPRSRASASILQELDGFEPVTAELARHAMTVWMDPIVQELVKSPTASSVVADSMEYLMKNLESISSVSYIPSLQDIARARVRTTGIVDSELLIQGQRWEVIDVGGLRSERGKWVKLFPNTVAIFYTASLASFDMALHEDPTVNRMDEALHLFELLCAEPKLAKVPKFVILTKVDVLRDKLAKGVRVAHYFPWYTGENELNSAVNFFKEAFLSLAPDRQLARVVVVDATNYESVSTQLGPLFTEVVQGTPRSGSPR